MTWGENSNDSLTSKQSGLKTVTLGSSGTVASLYLAALPNIQDSNGNTVEACLDWELNPEAILPDSYSHPSFIHCRLMNQIYHVSFNYANGIEDTKADTADLSLLKLDDCWDN